MRSVELGLRTIAITRTFGAIGSSTEDIIEAIIRHFGGVAVQVAKCDLSRSNE